MGHADTFDINKLNQVEELKDELKGSGSSELDKIYRGVESTLNTFNNSILKSMGANSSILLRTIYRSLDEELINILSQPKMVKLINNQLAKNGGGVKSEPIVVEQVTKLQPIRDTNIQHKTDVHTKNITEHHVDKTLVENTIKPVIKREQVEEEQEGETKTENIIERNETEVQLEEGSIGNEKFDNSQLSIIDSYLQSLVNIATEQGLYFSSKKNELETKHDDRKKEDTDYLKETLEANRKFEQEQEEAFLKHQVEKAKSDAEKEKKKSSLLKDLLTGKKKLHDLRPDVMLKKYIEKKRKERAERRKKRIEAIKQKIKEALSPKRIAKKIIKGIVKKIVKKAEDQESKQASNQQNINEANQKKESTFKSIFRKKSNDKQKQEIKRNLESKPESKPNKIQSVIETVKNKITGKKAESKKQDGIKYVIDKKQLINWDDSTIYATAKVAAEESAKRTAKLIKKAIDQEQKNKGNSTKLLENGFQNTQPRINHVSNAVNKGSTARIMRRSSQGIGIRKNLIGRSISAIGKFTSVARNNFNKPTFLSAPKTFIVEKFNFIKSKFTQTQIEPVEPTAPTQGDKTVEIKAPKVELGKPEQPNLHQPTNIANTKSTQPPSENQNQDDSSNKENEQNQLNLIDAVNKLLGLVTRLVSNKEKTKKNNQKQEHPQDQQPEATAQNKAKSNNTKINSPAKSRKSVSNQQKTSDGNKKQSVNKKPKPRKFSSLSPMEKKEYATQRKKENEQVSIAKKKEHEKSNTKTLGSIKKFEQKTLGKGVPPTQEDQLQRLNEKIEQQDKEHAEYVDNVEIGNKTFFDVFGKNFLKKHMPDFKKVESKLGNMSKIFSKMFKKTDEGLTKAEKEMKKKKSGFNLSAIKGIFIKLGVVILGALMMIAMFRKKTASFKDKYMPKKDQKIGGSGIKIFGIELPSFGNIFAMGKAIWRWVKEKGVALWQGVKRLWSNLSWIGRGGFKAIWSWLWRFLLKLGAAILIKKATAFLSGPFRSIGKFLAKIIPPPIGTAFEVIPDLILYIVRFCLMKMATNKIDAGKVDAKKARIAAETDSTSSSKNTLLKAGNKIKPLASVKSIIGAKTPGAKTDGLDASWNGSIMGGKLAKVISADSLKEGRKANKKIKYKAAKTKTPATEKSIAKMKNKEARMPYINSQIESLNKYAKSMTDASNKTFNNKKFLDQPLYNKSRGWNPNLIIKSNQLVSNIPNDPFAPVGNEPVTKIGSLTTPNKEVGGVFPYAWKNLNGNLVYANPYAFEAAKAKKLIDHYKDLALYLQDLQNSGKKDDKINKAQDKAFKKYDVKWQKALDPFSYGIIERRSFMMNGEEFVKFFNKYQTADKDEQKRMEKTTVKEVGRKTTFKDVAKKALKVAMWFYAPQLMLGITIGKVIFKNAKKIFNKANIKKVWNKAKKTASKVLGWFGIGTSDESRLKKTQQQFAKLNKKYSFARKFEDSTDIAKQFNNKKLFFTNMTNLLHKWLQKMVKSGFMPNGMTAPSKFAFSKTKLKDKLYFATNMSALGFMEWFISKYKKIDGLDISSLISTNKGRKQVDNFSFAVIASIYSIYAKPMKELDVMMLRFSKHDWEKEYPDEKKREEARRKEIAKINNKISVLSKNFTLSNFLKKISSTIKFKNLKIIKYTPPKLKDVETSDDKKNVIDGSAKQDKVKPKDEESKKSSFAKSVGKGILSFMKWTSPAYLAYRAAKKMAQVAADIGKAGAKAVKNQKDRIRNKWREWRDKMLSPQTLGELKETTYELSCSLQEYMKLMNESKNKKNMLVINQLPPENKPPIIFMDEPDM